VRDSGPASFSDFFIRSLLSLAFQAGLARRSKAVANTKGRFLGAVFRHVPAAPLVGIALEARAAPKDLSPGCRFVEGALIIRGGRCRVLSLVGLSARRDSGPKWCIA